MRQQRIFDAFVWLRANNSFYSDISIETNALAEQNDASGAGEDTESFLRSIVVIGMQEDAMINLLLKHMLRTQRRRNGPRDGSRAQPASSPVAWPGMEYTSNTKYTFSEALD